MMKKKVFRPSFDLKLSVGQFFASSGTDPIKTNKIVNRNYKRLE